MVPAAGTGPRTQGHASAAVALPRPSSDTEGPGDAPWAGDGETLLPVPCPPPSPWDDSGPGVSEAFALSGYDRMQS